MSSSALGGLETAGSGPLSVLLCHAVQPAAPFLAGLRPPLPSPALSCLGCTSHSCLARLGGTAAPSGDSPFAT